MMQAATTATIASQPLPPPRLAPSPLPSIDEGSIEAIETALAEKSLAHFIRQAWHVIEPNASLVWGRHLDAMCLHLEAVTRGDIQNLVITIPPGCTKSTLCSVCWPAWTWISDPAIRWLTSSNDADLVLRDAVSSRELIRSDWYQRRWGDRFRMTYDQNVKSWYKNDSKGFRTAVSVGAKVTGKKGDILLTDDPDDALKVRSETERRNVHEWWDKAFYNRVNNHMTGRRVVIGQRTHEDDLIGHILKTGKCVHLNLPEEFNPRKRCVTPIGWSDWRTEPGELLRPSMFGQDQVTEAKGRLRTDYQAQHNQDPTTEKGRVFQRDWLRYYRKQDQFWMFGELAYEPREIVRRFITVDNAATVKKTVKHDPDWTVISVWGVTRCGKLVWLDCFRIRCEIPDIPKHLWRLYDRWQVSKAKVSASGLEVGVPQLCRRFVSEDGRHMNVVDYTPRRDKLDNSVEAQGLAESGRLWLPGEDFPAFPLGDVENELLNFTGDDKQDAHDDIVDTLSIAAQEVTSKSTSGGRVVVGGSLRAGMVR